MKKAAKKNVKAKTVKNVKAKTVKKSTTTKQLPASEAAPSPVTPAHQWTNGGTEVMLLKCVDAEGRGYGGFQYPLEVGATVEAPDWDPANRCGGGLHGWAWGIGIGGGKQPNWSGIWLVIGVELKDIVHVSDDSHKDKARRGIIRCFTKPGEWQAATDFILQGQMAWTFHAARGSASNSGESGSASNSGASGSASNSGESGSASNSGWRGSASSLTPGTAAISTDPLSTVKAGPYCALALAWWNSASKRNEMKCREVGCGDGSDGKLKAGVWYRMNQDGEFVET